MNNNYEEEIEVLDGLDEDEEIDVIDNNQFDENKLIDDMLTPVSIEEFTGEYEDNSVDEVEVSAQQTVEPVETKEEEIEEIPVVNPVLGDINIVEPSLVQEETNNQVEESTDESVNNEEIPEEYGLGFESPEMTEEIGVVSDTEPISPESVPALESDAIVTEEQKQPELDEDLYDFDFSGEDNNDLGFTGDLGNDLSEANEIVNNTISNEVTNDISLEDQSVESNEPLEMPKEVEQISEIEASEPVEITSMASEEPKFEEDNGPEQNDDNSTSLADNEEKIEESEKEEPEEELKLKNKKKKKEKKEHKIKAKTVVFIILVLLLIAAFAVLVPTLLENMI